MGASAPGASAPGPVCTWKHLRLGFSRYAPRALREPVSRESSDRSAAGPGGIDSARPELSFDTSLAPTTAAHGEL
ncbi:hypothetical protein DdX_02229 [Ditylenchus destructor]|uniref:Uncharacterized protein n=1 Tax=Ditylenchus destructor TaxID=166010 RepID=A0AAD4RC24_9BILA|nr:hypothetical protein DdX_02229 [Ditylenchus destructor]